MKSLLIQGVRFTWGGASALHAGLPPGAEFPQCFWSHASSGSSTAGPKPRPTAGVVFA